MLKCSVNPKRREHRIKMGALKLLGETHPQPSVRQRLRKSEHAMFAISDRG